ncbi:RNA polymerase recycling motor HelD [Brevibacillus fulvus]|uniref:DNA 3'-5' helicase n=1 Tax=Brevibacillus fulvus TaxID=1125967 RepID=A0A938XTQ2_9BACL|nr:RNA polymerase recycling motor HelD [Brevibacillus fulvus]MBM7590303.1 DNA helicase-2/ATP-dependent DNA helicase PcrA [Brevibacillus fulvus]
MENSNQEWHSEQLRVNRVVAEIDRQLTALQQQVGNLRGEIIDIRKNFWEDVTVNFDDPHEAAETYASLKQQAEVLSERERSHRHALLRHQALLRLRQSPYFGRIDFREEGSNHSEQIYLGISSLLDQDELNFLVYDWRAPVSSLYYDYPPGPAQYETPGGTIYGTLDLKRQFIIRDGKIQSMFDTGITIGDELLQAVLGKQADTQMKSIVATIQKEQNQIIRNERSQLLIVQGAAGSGKTSAALQRVAYLLYRYRQTLQAEQIVLFSPNPMFNSYISTVLPELGEENMQQTTFQDYLERRLGDHFHVEDPYTLLEFALTAADKPGYAARMESARFKASPDFMQLIEQYAASLGNTGMVFHDLRHRDEVLISASEISELFYRQDPALNLPNRMRLLAEQLLRRLQEREQAEQEKSWVEDEIELLDKDAYTRAYQQLRRERRGTQDSFDDYAREQEILSRYVVRQTFKPIQQQIKQLAFINMPAIYRKLFADPSAIRHHAGLIEQLHYWPDICAQTIARLDNGELPYEDATPYLYLQELIEGFRRNTTVRHVFIDEAQDYSAFQFAFLRHLFPRSRFTVLGDLNQAIQPFVPGEFAPLMERFKPEQIEMLRLSRSYRSTRPIVEFTKGLIPGGEAIEPFNRDGNKPTLISCRNQSDLIQKICQLITRLQTEPYQTIAVICKTADESKLAYEALREQLPVQLVEKNATTFKPGVLIIPSYLAKGIEFDVVILFNASAEQYGDEMVRKLFYTACTRAMHELYLCYRGELSPFVKALPPDTYVRMP